MIIQILSSYQYKLIGKNGAASLRAKNIKKMNEGIEWMNTQSVCIVCIVYILSYMFKGSVW